MSSSPAALKRFSYLDVSNVERGLAALVPHSAEAPIATLTAVRTLLNQLVVSDRIMFDQEMRTSSLRAITRSLNVLKASMTSDDHARLCQKLGILEYDDEALCFIDVNSSAPDISQIAELTIDELLPAHSEAARLYPIVATVDKESGDVTKDPTRQFRPEVHLFPLLARSIPPSTDEIHNLVNDKKTTGRRLYEGILSNAENFDKCSRAYKADHLSRELAACIFTRFRMTLAASAAVNRARATDCISCHYITSPQREQFEMEASGRTVRSRSDLWTDDLECELYKIWRNALHLRHAEVKHYEPFALNLAVAKSKPSAPVDLLLHCLRASDEYGAELRRSIVIYESIGLKSREDFKKHVKSCFDILQQNGVPVDESGIRALKLAGKKLAYLNVKGAVEVLIDNVYLHRTAAWKAALIIAGRAMEIQTTKETTRRLESIFPGHVQRR
jgi:hypothetical protein